MSRQIIAPHTRSLLYAFRMVHINNVPYIMKNGIIHHDSPLADPSYITIGDNEVIRKRKQETYNGLNLDGYIPFYFGPRTPMLYVIQYGKNGVLKRSAEELVYCVIRLQDIMDSHLSGCFTDGHAMSEITNIYDITELANIDKYVNVADVFEKYWRDENDLDLKRRKEAELLVKENIPSKFIRGFIVYNEKAKETLIAYGVTQPIAICPSYYY